MAVEGFIGLDVERACAVLQKFHDSALDIELNYSKTLRNLFATLEVKWASPVAVDFSKKISQVTTDLYRSFSTTSMHIVSGAEEAATILARANGISFPQRFAVSAGSYDNSHFTCSCKTDIHGLVGMDKASVKIAVDVFEAEMKSVLQSLEHLPKGIAFYDSENNLVNTYDRNIDEFISTFSSECEDLVKDMRGYIETEIDNILLAKNEASDTMSA